MCSVIRAGDDSYSSDRMPRFCSALLACVCAERTLSCCNVITVLSHDSLLLALCSDCLDIRAARVLLDNDHYALEKLKRRVLEYLAVRQLKSSLKGPILCFVGPPGVGKTSVGRSIARTLGREFHRIALGGVCDQSDIRGHRYTRPPV